MQMKHGSVTVVPDWPGRTTPLVDFNLLDVHFSNQGKASICRMLFFHLIYEAFRWLMMMMMTWLTTIIWIECKKRQFIMKLRQNYNISQVPTWQKLGRKSKLIKTNKLCTYQTPSTTSQICTCRSRNKISASHKRSYISVPCCMTTRWATSLFFKPPHPPYFEPCFYNSSGDMSQTTTASYCTFSFFLPLCPSFHLTQGKHRYMNLSVP